MSAVIEARNFLGVPEIKNMADGGQNFFKVCTSVFFKDQPSDPSSYDSDDESFCEPQKKKRKLYTEGRTKGHTAKLTSVKGVVHFQSIKFRYFLEIFF